MVAKAKKAKKGGKGKKLGRGKKLSNMQTLRMTSPPSGPIPIPYPN